MGSPIHRDCLIDPKVIRLVKVLLQSLLRLNTPLDQLVDADARACARELYGAALVHAHMNYMERRSCLRT